MHSVLTGPLTLERVTVAISDLPLSLHGITLVQLSDLHYDGRHLSPALLQQAIAACNALMPDLVVLTGDFVTDEPTPIHALAQHLATLKSQQGVYAVLGNHDILRPESAAIITDALQQSGIQVLWNQIAYPLGEALPLVGLADLQSGDCHPDLLATVPPWKPRLVLAHNPDTAEMLHSLRADLQLSGHTHGGQIAIPGVGTLPSLALPLRQGVPSWLRRAIPYLADDCAHAFRHWEWAAGLYRLGRNQLYVNRGLGTYYPGRFCCPPELTVITLVRG